MKVTYVNTGLANYYGDHVEINRALKSNKILRDFIIKHEMGHKRGFDLSHEINDGVRLMLRPKLGLMLLKFYITHPSTWIDALPIQYKNREIVYDLNLSILYLMIILLIIAIFIIF